MNTAHDFICPLYHGTRRAAARSILQSGFRRSRSTSYTGTGICLSEALSVAYEYGAYETGGCVLEVELSASARWADRSGYHEPERGADRDAWDDFFKASGLDAARAYGGNVWVLWNPHAVAQVRRLSHREAMRLLCAKFDEDGPECGYNGVASEYAGIWWGQADQDVNLTRFPEQRKRLERTLSRLVGRVQSGSAALVPAPTRPLA